MHLGFRMLIVATLLAPPNAGAQLPDLQPGVRVRVIAPPALASRYEATVGARRADTLTLVRQGAAPVDLSVASISKVEIYMGRSRSAGAKRGLLWGAGVGVAVTLLFLSVPDRDLGAGATSRRLTAGDVARFGTLMTVGYGAWGAGIGALVRREEWRPVVVGSSPPR